MACGRGDFLASWARVYVLQSDLETLRDRSHFLYQRGESPPPPGGQHRLAIVGSTFRGVSLDPLRPAGVTNLSSDAVVYLLFNTLLDGIGTNRPVVHFHDEAERLSSVVYHAANEADAALVWDHYSVPKGQGLSVRPVDGPFVQALAVEEAGTLTPDVLLDGWNPLLPVCGVGEPRDSSSDRSDEVSAAEPEQRTGGTGAETRIRR